LIVFIQENHNSELKCAKTNLFDINMQMQLYITI